MKFIRWHYSSAWITIIRLWPNFLQFALHIFSVPLLVKTLFSPWHRIKAENQTPGFNIAKILDKFSLNLISRLIGGSIRLVLIGAGLILWVIFAVMGALIIIIWPLTPCLSWLIFLAFYPKPKTTQELIQTEAKDFILQRLGITDLKELEKINNRDIEATVDWFKKLKTIKIKRQKFWQKENLLAVPSIGHDLAYGFTHQLDRFCEDLSASPPFSIDLVGRQDEVNRIQAVLCKRQQSNALIVGEPGVGKHAILMGLARSIGEKKVSPSLFYHRVLNFRIDEVLGEEKSLDQGKNRLVDLLEEAKSAGNVILVIKNLADFVSDKKGHDLTTLMTRYMHSGKVKFVATATPAEFERYILPNEAIMKYIDKQEIRPATKEEALELLEVITPRFEEGKKITVMFGALRRMVDQSDRLISDLPFPEKAVDLLDQVIQQATAGRKTLVTAADVDRLITEKLKIPVATMSQDEKVKLLTLTKLLEEKIVGQKEAIRSLTDAMQRARIGLTERNKPMGSFLFLGPTGVGKTATAKALASVYFGSEKEIIRFDMAEFQGDEAVAALIGSSRTEKPGCLTKTVREKPYSVLLLDEFEKAPKEVVNLFMTVLDEGYLKDYAQKKVSFANLIIICTSNAAGEFIRETINNKKTVASGELKNKVIEHCLSFGIFTPELLNRFDGVIIYHPLADSEIRLVAERLLNDLAAQMKKKNILLRFDRSVIDYLTVQGYDLAFGVRPLQRLIADKIESPVAKKILEGSLVKGSHFNISVTPQGEINLVKVPVDRESNL